MTRDFFADEIEDIILCDSLYESLRMIEKHAFDLILLDLNLNGKDGFDLLKILASEPFHAIIISAYKEKAITAFEYGVLDFVPKPFNRERLFQAFQRISNTDRTAPGNLKYLAIKKRKSLKLLDIQQLLYIRGAGVYTELVRKDGKTETHSKSLEKLENLLPPHFVRIHKSYIIDISEAAEIIVESGSKYSVRLKDGTVLPIGRTRYKLIKDQWFSD